MLTKVTMQNMYRTLFSGYTETVTLFYRNRDGKINEFTKFSKWIGQAMPVTEAGEDTTTMLIVDRRNFKLFVNTCAQDNDPPRIGDQIHRPNGEIWEIVGPIFYKTLNNVYEMDTIKHRKK